MSKFVPLLEHERVLAERDEINKKHDNMKIQRTHDVRQMNSLGRRMKEYQSKFRNVKAAIKEWQSYIASCESKGMMQIYGDDGAPVPAFERIKSFNVNSPPEEHRSSKQDKNTTTSPLRNVERVSPTDANTNGLAGSVPDVGSVTSKTHNCTDRDAGVVQNVESVASTTNVCTNGNAAPLQEGDVVPSSQTTDEVISGEDAPTKPRAQPTTIPSSPPVVVMERSLKRKRTNDTDNKHATISSGNRDHERGTNVKPIEIKEEENSPVGLGGVPDTHYMDSIDLDEIPEPIVTPRKRKHLRQLRSNLMGPFFTDGYDLPHLVQEKSNSQPDEEGEFHDLGDYGLSEQRFTRSFGGSGSEAISGSISNVRGPRPPSREPIPAQQQNERRAPLRQINRNTRPVPWDEFPTKYAKRRRRTEDVAKKPAMLTEDGEELAPGAGGHLDRPEAAKTNHSHAPARVEPGTSTGRKLNALLESSPSKPKPVTSRTTNPEPTLPQPTSRKLPTPPTSTGSTPAPPAQQPAISAPAKPTANLPNTSRTTTRPPHQPRRSWNPSTDINAPISGPPPPPNPHLRTSAPTPHSASPNPSSRLRDRHPSTLQLTDFRVNPQANAGRPLPLPRDRSRPRPWLPPRMHAPGVLRRRTAPNAGGCGRRHPRCTDGRRRGRVQLC